MDAFNKCIELMKNKDDVIEFLRAGTLDQNTNLLIYLEEKKLYQKYNNLHELLECEVYRKTSLNYIHHIEKYLNKKNISKEKLLELIDNTKRAFVYLTCD